MDKPNRPPPLTSRISIASIRSAVKDPQVRITFYLIWIVAVICLGSLQFGFHLGELNATQRVISCKTSVPHLNGPLYYKDTLYGQHGMNQCIPMSSRDGAMVTTMLSIGGLFGSIVVGDLANTYGRHKICLINSLLYFIGSSILTTSNSILHLCIGRFIAGLAAGSVLVVSPMLINEITPVTHRGVMGTMMQFSVSFGILLSQLVSFYWANDQQWRNMFVLISFIAVLNFVLLFTIPESPKWLIKNRNNFDKATSILKKIRFTKQEVEYELDHWKEEFVTPYANNTDINKYNINTDDANETTQLLPMRSRRGSLDMESSAIPINVFLSYKTYRKEMIAVVLVMTASQLTGVNSITFYGVSVLNSVISSSVLFINLMLSLVNLVSVGIASPLVDKLGRKPLLLVSISLMGISSIVLAFSIQFSMSIFAFISVFTFVAGYSFGVGPIPFLMVSEMTDHHCIGAAQSFGTFLNWLASIFISFFFPILQDIFGGYVFLIFTFACIFYFITVYQFVPETKGKTDYSQVWGVSCDESLV